jgi:hypothetical protein
MSLDGAAFVVTRASAPNCAWLQMPCLSASTCVVFWPVSQPLTISYLLSKLSFSFSSNAALFGFMISRPISIRAD